MLKYTLFFTNGDAHTTIPKFFFQNSFFYYYLLHMLRFERRYFMFSKETNELYLKN